MRTSLCRKIQYGFLGGFCVCAHTVGQSRLDSVQQLKEIIVTAPAFKEVIPSQILSGKELENLNGHSVADALRYFSGIQLKDYGGIGGLKTVNIRSMGTNHLGVFYDGIELSNAQNGQVDLGMYSLENMDEISLYNGQKSEIFQSAKDFGAAGTLYLRSRRPRFDNGKNTHLRATAKAGSFDVINPSLLFEHRISGNISASFSAEWLNGSGKYKFRYRRVNPAGDIAYDTTAVRENGDINATRMETGLYGTINNGTWNVKLYSYNSERGIPGAIVNNVSEQKKSEAVAPARRRRLLLALGAAALLVLVWGATAFATTQHIFAGSTVSGVAVGNMSPAQAQSAVAGAIDARLGQPVTLVVGNATDTLVPAESGVSVDARASVERLTGFTLNPLTLIERLRGADVDALIFCILMPASSLRYLLSALRPLTYLFLLTSFNLLRFR